jgi:hypothetical protein
MDDLFFRRVAVVPSCWIGAIQLVLVCLAGAATPTGTPPGNLYGGMRFSEYVGPAYMEWPISATGAMKDSTYAVAVYRGWPERPYRVMGDIKHKDPRKTWHDDRIRDAAKSAKNVGADAIIIRLGAEGAVQAVTGAVNPGIVFSQSSQVTALAIRWLTEAELAERQDLLRAVVTEFKQANPALQANEDALSLLAKHLLQSGIAPRTDDFRRAFAENAQRIMAADGTSLAGGWVFKATVSERRITSTDEQSYMGLALVAERDGVINLVSEAGNVELSFSGSEEKGTLKGTLGIAGYSLAASGVAFAEKISISFSDTTAGGVMRGTVVLQRMVEPQASPQPKEANEKGA